MMDRFSIRYFCYFYWHSDFPSFPSRSIQSLDDWNCMDWWV